MSDKTKKILKIVGNAVLWTFLAFVLSFYIVSFIDVKTNYKAPFLGIRSSVIVSESMSRVDPSNESYITEDMQQIQKFDVIIAKKYKSFDDIEIYDIATYVSEEGLICHRVIDKYTQNGVDYVVFRGDANNIDDSPVAFSMIRGKVTKVIPNFGKFVLFTQSPYMIIAVFGSVFFIALGIFLIDYKMKKNSREEPVKEQEVVEASPKEEPVPEQPKVEEEKPEEQPQEEKPKKKAPSKKSKEEQK